MICLSWNCRGLGQPRTVLVLCDLVHFYKPDAISIFETISFAKKIEEVHVHLGFDCCFSVDRNGRSGGIGVLWRSSALCSVISYSNNHVDLIISDRRNPEWCCTGFYRFPKRHHKRVSWNFLKTLCASSHLPWCCIRDFNDLLNPEDKRGHVEHHSWLLRGFRETVMECDLMDLLLEGYKFTWERCRGTKNHVEERIDRALVTTAWKDLFPNTKFRNLLAPVSDHIPILLDTYFQEGQISHKLPI